MFPDRHLDPATPIDVDVCYRCGILLTSYEPEDECPSCRAEKIKARTVPVWPLAVCVVFLLVLLGMMVPLGYSTYKIVVGG